PDGVILCHGIPPDILFGSAYLDAGLVLRFHLLCYPERGEITLCTSRVTDVHGIIALLHASHGDRHDILWPVRYVIDTILGRLVVPVGIDAEHREVARVAGPHPVVGIAAILSHRRWRGNHQPDIAEDIVDHLVIFVSRI